MGLDASDLVDNLLDEQARRNAANPNPGATDNLVTDFQTVYPPEKVGLDGADSIATTASSPPHHWGDPVAVTAWGFWSWGH